MSQLEPISGALEPIVAAVQKPMRILVTSHLNPDGDAIGATLSLGLVLEAMGHRVTFFNPDSTPDVFAFLPESKRMERQLPAGVTFDATFVIDVFDLPRTGLAKVPREVMGKLYILDHHLTKTQPGDLHYIDPNAAASGLLVYRFAKLAGIKITREIALSIYCCIMTDTGSFHYSSATPESFQVAGEMVASGVNPWEFALNVYESQPEKRLRLLAEVLKSLDVSADGKFAAVHVEYATLKRFAAGADLTDGFINYPRSIAGVEVAIFLRQNADGSYKASLRSSGKVDVRLICERLGGGGHRNAAGCTLQGDFVQVRNQIYAATKTVCEAIG